jgi:hypothetical protein
MGMAGIRLFGLDVNVIWWAFRVNYAARYRHVTPWNPGTPGQPSRPCGPVDSIIWSARPAGPRQFGIQKLYLASTARRSRWGLSRADEKPVPRPLAALQAPNGAAYP